MQNEKNKKQEVTSSPKNTKATGKLSSFLKKVCSVAFGFTTNSVVFAFMLAITLGFDKYVFGEIFALYGHKDVILVELFKLAKYAAILVELVFWVYGIYKECQHHDDDDEGHD